MKLSILSANENFRKGLYKSASSMYRNLIDDMGYGLLNFNLWKSECLNSKASSGVECASGVEYYGFYDQKERVGNRRYIVGVATMPSRIDVFQKVIHKVLPQVDAIHVYLNNFDNVPAFLYKEEKIVIHRSQEFGDIRDNGKFFGLNFSESDAYYFTIDDDIEYPDGYFSVLANRVNYYNNLAVIGVHGALYPQNANNFFNRISFHFSNQLKNDLPVSVLGTGTVCFYVQSINIRVKDINKLGMLDLVFGGFLKSNRIPAVIISRPVGWLKEYKRENKNDTIYQETKLASKPYDDYIASQSPWGTSSVLDSINSIIPLLERDAVEFITYLDSLNCNDFLNKNKILFSTLSFFETCGLNDFAVSRYYEFSLNAVAAIYSSIPELNIIFSEYDSILKSFICGSCKDREVQTVANIGKSTFVDIINHVLLSVDDECLKLSLYMVQLLNSNESNKAINEISVWALRNNKVSLFKAVLNHFGVSCFSEESLCVSYKYSVLLGLDIAGVLKSEVIKRELDENYLILHAELIGKILSDGVGFSYILCKFLEQKIKTKMLHRMVAELRQLISICHPTITYDNEIINLFWNSESALTKSILFEFGLQTGNLHRLGSVDCLIGYVESMEPTSIDETDLKILSVYQSFYNKTDYFCTQMNKLFLRHGMRDITLGARKENILDNIFSSGVAVEERYSCLIVIASFNAESTLQYAYDSICNQTYRNIEVVVVDDGSRVAVADFLVINPKVNTVIVRNEASLGPYECRNIALKLRNSDYFAVQDADDWAHPEKIAMQILSLQQSEAVCNYGRHVRVRSNGLVVLENHGEFIGHGPVTGLFDRKVFRDVGLFDNVFTRGDVEFKARIAKFYGKDSIFEDDRIYLFALDWMSNSKNHISSYEKVLELQTYKRNYINRHILIPFISANS